MKEIRKKLAILLIIASMAFSFASCGNADNKENLQQTDAGSQTAAAGADKDREGTGHEAPSGVSIHEQNHSGNFDGDIGYDAVKSIVLDKISGAVDSDFTELEREHDDGRLEYEGSVYYNGYEYEFEIDGATGTILQWEIDKED